MPERDPGDFVPGSIGREGGPVRRRRILHPLEVDDVVHVRAVVEVARFDAPGEAEWRRASGRRGHGAAYRAWSRSGSTNVPHCICMIALSASTSGKENSNVSTDCAAVDAFASTRRAS